MSNLPYHRVNVLTGIKQSVIIEKPEVYANIIKKAKRPLLVLGPICKHKLGEKLLLEYALQIAKAKNIPITATADINKRILENGVCADSTYDIIEIINALKDETWTGVKGEGNHDLVMFLGIRSDLGTQGLSTLKHFAPHLKTMTLCKFVFPNATYSMPNLKDEKWQEFLENLISKLNEN